ncbi:MAG: L-2-amino-thiazoline-4-carboxylic acid hydrolase [Pirellulales bacterium]|nr:L-2-amino-thiazoline-4-carboxylic acid hydrolase [Pirellulales bacterium]
MNREGTLTADATISAAGMRIVRLLVGRPPTTVASLIRVTGVTRTAVTEQLNELVGAGFVERRIEKLTGRGRPRHLYSATNHALLLLFASNQSQIVPAMWQSILEVGGEELVQRVLGRVSRALAEHYRQRIRGTTPQRRLDEMLQLLREEGSIVEVEKDKEGQLLLHRRSCPFFSMFDERTKAVCCIDQAMISEVVGAPIRRTACRHDGAPCCTFELASRNGK